MLYHFGYILFKSKCKSLPFPEARTNSYISFVIIPFYISNYGQVMAIVADFMLVWLPAPTVSLRPPPAVSAGLISKFFYACPENAFQVSTS